MIAIKQLPPNEIIPAPPIAILPFYQSKDVNRKEVTVPIPIVKGKNTIRITVTNINSLSETQSGEFDYDQ